MAEPYIVHEHPCFSEDIHLYQVRQRINQAIDDGSHVLIAIPQSLRQLHLKLNTWHAANGREVEAYYMESPVTHEPLALILMPRDLVNTDRLYKLLEEFGIYNVVADNGATKHQFDILFLTTDLKIEHGFKVWLHQQPLLN